MAAPNPRIVEDLIGLAFARTKRANPDSNDVSFEGELIPIMNEIMGTWFQEGSRANPEWFSVETEVSYNTTKKGWPRPADAELIHWIVGEDNNPVKRVPIENREAEPGKPTLYRLGGLYRVANTNRGPSAGNKLTFVYSRIVEPITDLRQEIDERWPEGHEQLIALELALYMAAKDNRRDELPFLIAQRDRQGQRFIAFLEHEDIGTVSERGLARPFTSRMIHPVMSMEVGG